jgi:hypothetical protein
MATRSRNAGAFSQASPSQTMGGRSRAPKQIGDEHYLMVLVVLEVLVLAALRAGFKRSHGG